MCIFTVFEYIRCDTTILPLLCCKLWCLCSCIFPESQPRICYPLCPRKQCDFPLQFNQFLNPLSLTIYVILCLFDHYTKGGKSAIECGISMVLGCRAKKTGRGEKINDVIKFGEKLSTQFPPHSPIYFSFLSLSVWDR